MRYVGQFYEIEVPLPSALSPSADDLSQCCRPSTPGTRNYTISDLPERGDGIPHLFAAGHGGRQSPPSTSCRWPRARRMRRRRSSERGDACSRRGWIETPCYDGRALLAGNVIAGPAIIEEEGDDDGRAGELHLHGRCIGYLCVEEDDRAMAETPNGSTSAGDGRAIPGDGAWRRRPAYALHRLAFDAAHLPRNAPRDRAHQPELSDLPAAGHIGRDLGWGRQHHCDPGRPADAVHRREIFRALHNQ